MYPLLYSISDSLHLPIFSDYKGKSQILALPAITSKWGRPITLGHKKHNPFSKVHARVKHNIYDLHSLYQSGWAAPLSLAMQKYMLICALQGAAVKTVEPIGGVVTLEYHRKENNMKTYFNYF